MTSGAITAGRVDPNALKTNQVCIVAGVLIAFVLGSNNGGAWIVAFIAASLALGVIRPGYGPFQLLYRHALVPSGLVKPRPVVGDSAPYRFAQILGSVFLALSAILLFAGAITLGWVLAWIVLTLAFVNLAFNFCAGCFMFLQLRRAGLFQ